MRFLALHLGKPCTELRRTESERILRAQPFLAEAYVTAFRDQKGGVEIVVTTVDEISAIVGGNIRSSSPHIRGLKLGEANLFGDAIYAAFDWRAEPFFRDEITLKLIDYQILARPYQFTANVTRRDLGKVWGLEAAHPYFTDLQRIAWRTSLGSDDGYRIFSRVNALPAAIRFTRSYSDVGAVRRVGPVGGLLLVGASMSHEREVSAKNPVLIIDSLIVPDTSKALTNRYAGLHSTRLNALLGFRKIAFMRANGFETLEADEDVRTGIQIGTLFGKGFTWMESDDRDTFLSSVVFFGGGSPKLYGAVEAIGEGRHNAVTTLVDGALVSGRAAAYWKRGGRLTVLPSMEYSAGWKQRSPFQVTFADRDGGIIGYRDGDEGGARRVVLRMDSRYDVGKVGKIAAFGIGGFMHAGKIWAGDAPFGVNTPVRASAGLSLLAAVPAHSQRLWRVDFATPFSHGGQGRWEVRLSAKQFSQIFWREPGDVVGSRLRSIPTNIFNWP